MFKNHPIFLSSKILVCENKFFYLKYKILVPTKRQSADIDKVSIIFLALNIEFEFF